MKGLLYQAITFSIILHLIFFIGTSIKGYILTKKYVPNLETGWKDAENLSHTVEFGSSISPSIYILSFIGVTIGAGMILFVVKKALH